MRVVYRGGTLPVVTFPAKGGWETLPANNWYDIKFDEASVEGTDFKKELSGTLTDENGRHLCKSVYISVDHDSDLYLFQGMGGWTIRSNAPQNLLIETGMFRIHTKDDPTRIRLIASIWPRVLVEEPEATPTDFIVGQATMTTTPSNAPINITRPIRSVAIQASPANAAGTYIYVGRDTTMTTTAGSHILAPGASVTIPIDNLDKVYVMGSVAGLILSYIAEL